MEENAVETSVDAKTSEGDQFSTSRKQGIESEHLEISTKGFSENEEGEGGEEDGKATEEGNTEEGEESEMSPEALKAKERAKKKKKREEMKLARAMLDRHHKAPVAEPEPEPDQEEKQEPKSKEHSGEEDAQEGELERQSQKYEGSSQISLQAEDNLLNLRGSLAVSETEDIRTAVSSSESESHYSRGPQGVSFKADFLEYFILPNLSDISSESSEEQLASLRHTIEKFIDIEPIDKGKFVNPLTGETESESSKKEDEQAKEEVEEEQEEEESSSSIEFEWPFEDDDFIPIAPKVEDADTALELFLDLGQSATHIRAESTTAVEAEKAAREVQQVVFTFLAKMIEEAVNTAEYVDPIKELRGKLDKQKLYTQLQKLYGQYLAAKFFNVDVNNKMYDYYRRVGQLRGFDVLPPKVELVEYHRYMDAIHQLDHLKRKIDETKMTNSELLASVKMDLEYVHNLADVSVHALETCMREVLLRKDAEFLPRIVENDLYRMQKMRNEVSDSRLWLITRQHTLGSLLERKRNFYQITEDLTMDQFLITQREVTALGTKVEERNHDLNRMRDRCTKHMHQLAFIREKTSSNSAMLCAKRIELDEKLKTQEQLRAKLLKLKIQHSSLNIQKAELHEKCGLLFKPALLNDFDRTVEHIEVKRERVKKLRKTVVELESRIAEFEREARDSDFSYYSRQSNLRKSTRGTKTKR